VSEACVVISVENRGQSTLAATATRGRTTNIAPTAAGTYSQRGNPVERVKSAFASRCKP
jgi:hypothetical protein